MLDFSWGHIFIVMLVALVVVGPKDLPRLMRIVGQWVGKARHMADEFRKSFDDMARQSELDELRKEIENLRSERPLASIEHELNQSIVPDDMKSSSGPAPIAAPATAQEHLDAEAPPPPRTGELVAADEPGAEPLAAAGYTPPQP